MKNVFNAVAQTSLIVTTIAAALAADTGIINTLVPMSQHINNMHDYTGYAAAATFGPALTIAAVLSPVSVLSAFYLGKDKTLSIVTKTGIAASIAAVGGSVAAMIGGVATSIGAETLTGSIFSDTARTGIKIADSGIKSLIGAVPVFFGFAGVGILRSLSMPSSSVSSATGDDNAVLIAANSALIASNITLMTSSNIATNVMVDTSPPSCSM